MGRFVKLSTAALVLIVAVLAAVLLVPLDDKPETHTPFKAGKTSDRDVLIKGENYLRTTHFFACGSVQCEAWLFLPTGSAVVVDTPPVIVMAHGMGSQKDFGLDAFYEPFASAGMAVFVFDYRTFGGSGGETPFRNYVSGPRHVEDYESALKHVQTLKGVVDTSRVGLWGTSFSGGHVLVTAANHPEISAVVSQVPYLKFTPKATEFGLTYFGKMIAFTLRDVLRSFLNMPPYMVQFVGDASEGDLSLLATPDSKSYLKKVGDSPRGGWQNKIWARLGLEIMFYTPMAHLEKITSPVLLVAAKKDALCPMTSVAEAEEKIANLDLYLDDVGHFEYYRGGRGYERNIRSQTAFLVEHLLPGSAPASNLRGAQ